MKTKIQHAPLWRYRNLPNGDKHDFPEVIRGFNASQGYRITLEEAKEIFRLLVRMSRNMKEDGRPDEQYIVCYSIAGKTIWKGRWTPAKCESLGLVRKGNRGAQSEGSHRQKFGK